MSVDPFLGMRGTGDWATNERPENWRQLILRLYPNGSAPLTAITSMMGAESTDDPIFHWWTKKLPVQGGTVANVWTDAGLSAAATGAFVVGTTLYAQMAAAVAEEFRVDHTALFSKDGNHNFNNRGVVVDRAINGASSYVAIQLLAAATSSFDVASTDNIDVIGSAHREGAEMPEAISYDPTEFSNVTQIYRTALQITDTARQTRYRTGEKYLELKMEALQNHSIEHEKGSIFGVRRSTTQDGKPKRFTQGIIDFIIANAQAENVSDYRTQAGNGGVAWTAAAGGRKWLNEHLEAIFRHGANEKLGICGNQVVLGISRIAETFGTLNINPATTFFGIKTLEWITPFGTLFLLTHPLFNNRSTWRNQLIVTEPRLMKYRHVQNRDTRFISDPRDTRNTNNSTDGTEEEYITEAGYEWHHPDAMGYLTGFNLDGTTSA